jgi:hypothetical protein
LQGVFGVVRRDKQLPQEISQPWREPLNQLGKRRFIPSLSAHDQQRSVNQLCLVGHAAVV